MKGVSLQWIKTEFRISGTVWSLFGYKLSSLAWPLPEACMGFWLLVTAKEVSKLRRYGSLSLGMAVTRWRSWWMKGFSFLWIKTEFRMSGRHRLFTSRHYILWPLAEASFLGNGRDGCGEGMNDSVYLRWSRWMGLSGDVDGHASGREDFLADSAEEFRIPRTTWKFFFTAQRLYPWHLQRQVFIPHRQESVFWPFTRVMGFSSHSRQ